MLKKLLPQSGTFMDYFEKHAAFVVQGAKGLLSFALPDHDPYAVLELVRYCEEEGDQVTHKCMEELHKTFITPIERGDIHVLISKMDDILDEIEDVAGFMVLYKLKKFSSDAEKLAHVVVESAKEMESAVKELRKMKNTEQMHRHFININRLENEADHLLTQALGRLFDEEEDTKMIIKWKEVYEHLESATDACEDVADILEGIILENE